MNDRREKQAEADDEDERRGPESVLEQPSGFGSKLGAVGRHDPSCGQECTCRRWLTRGCFRARASLGRRVEVRHKPLNIPPSRRAWQTASSRARKPGRSRSSLWSAIGLRVRPASAGLFERFRLRFRRTRTRLTRSKSVSRNDLTAGPGDQSFEGVGVDRIPEPAHRTVAHQCVESVGPETADRRNWATGIKRDVSRAWSRECSLATRQPGSC